MFTKHYDLTINTPAGSDTIMLRLPFLAQSNLCKKYKTGTVQLLLDAATDNDVLVDVLTNSLMWKGNSNNIKDGAELVELLIDNGVIADDVSRAKLMLNIAEASGVVSAEKRDTIIKAITKKENDTLNSILEEDTETEAEGETDAKN